MSAGDRQQRRRRPSSLTMTTITKVWYFLGEERDIERGERNGVWDWVFFWREEMAVACERWESNSSKKLLTAWQLAACERWEMRNSCVWEMRERTVDRACQLACNCVWEVRKLVLKVDCREREKRWQLVLKGRDGRVSDDSLSCVCTVQLSFSQLVTLCCVCTDGENYFFNILIYVGRSV